jgi:hypothetical protein
MDSKLPATGAAQYLNLVSPHVPDRFIHDLMPRRRGRGRRQAFSPTPLYRVHLLSVLTPVHAFNQLVRLLSERRAWRRCARLASRQAVPDVGTLNQLRERCGVTGLRQVNDPLLKPLLPKSMGQDVSVGLIDATDLEAACSGHKKRPPASMRRTERRWEDEPSNADRAVSWSDTRSPPSASGCSAIAEASCWRRRSVG